MIKGNEKVNKNKININDVKRDKKSEIKFYQKQVKKIIKFYKINKDDICSIYTYLNEPSEKFPVWVLHIQIQTLDDSYDEIEYLKKPIRNGFKTTYNNLMKGRV